MERFDCRAGAKDPRAITLVLYLAQAFEHASFPVVWAWTTHFQFSMKIMRVLCGYFQHQSRVQFEGCVVEPLQNITDILPGSKWSCLLLRTVLQDALSKVVKVFPPLKLKVFVEDITAFMEGRYNELAGIAEKVLMSIKGKVEENCSKLSNTEGGKVGQGKVMAMCGYLEETFWECNKKRMELATSVGTLGVDLKQPGAKETARRKKCDVRFSLTRKNEVFQKNYMRIGVVKLLRMGLVSEIVRRGQAVGIAPTERLKLRRKMAAAACKKKSVSLSLFMEVNSLEVEEELSTMATLFCAKGVCGWEDGRERENRRRRGGSWVFEVQGWRQVKGPGGAVMRGTRALGIKWPQWYTLMFEEQVTVDMRVVCPQNVQQVLLKQARLVGLLEEMGNNARL